jgi:hypothetical protein
MITTVGAAIKMRADQLGLQQNVEPYSSYKSLFSPMK